jgi:glycosyltransferase involved in cell wall biosynthesis
MDFSIIIPAKNEEKNIQMCLQSIANIDYPVDKYEVLLIDNGSTDNTVTVAQSFGINVHIQPDLTIAGLRNFGARHASGNVLVFLDADCTVDPDWLISASVWLEDDDVCCYGSPPEVPGNATWVQKSWYIVRGKNQDVMEVEWLESMNMFVKSVIFDEINGFDETLITCEDYDLSLRLRQHGRIVADRRIRAVHHGEAASLSHFYKKESWRGTSNLKGLKQHGFHWQELPSLLLPVVYSLCLLLSLGLVFGYLFHIEGLTLTKVMCWILIWQTPILVLAFRKGNAKATTSLKLGLYLLFNVYFLARTRAMLRVDN